MFSAKLVEIAMDAIEVVRHKLSSFAIAICVAVQFAAGAAWAGGILDGNEDFKVMATLGMAQALDGPHPEGSELNNYAWSMAWFKGKLYVGTARFQTDGTQATLDTMTGQIWAYTPAGTGGANGKWALAFQSPAGVGGPREFGYRWMTPCTIGGVDYLFISTAGIVAGNILRTSDGVTFTPLSRIGYPSGTVGFRTMACFTEASGQKVLVTTPVGKGGNTPGTYDTDTTDNPIALVNESPTSILGNWRNYSPLRMNDPNNNAFFTMYVWGNYLYTGVDNDVTGAQLWKTAGCPTTANCTPTWTKVLDGGAGRPFNTDGTVKNVGLSDIMAFNGALYMGVSVPTGNKPPAELWRVWPDDTFEIVIGEPRLNVGTNPALPANFRCGLPLEDIDGAGGANDCPPTSRRGAGFGVPSDATGKYPDGTQSYFWRLHNYAYHPTNAPLGDNRLYFGTLEGYRRGGTGGGGVSGFDVDSSANGVDWYPITRDGFGDANQGGMRAIATSPIGLFIGSANFPSTRAGHINGFDVWLGVPAPESQPPVTTLASPPSPDEGSTLVTRNVTFSWTATDGPGLGSYPLTYAYRLDPLEPAFSAFGSATTRNYPKLLNGTYTFYAIAKDSSGNAETPGAAPGASNRRTFTVNAPDLPPGVSILTAPATPNTTGNASFTWVGSDDLTPVPSLVYDSWLTPLQSDTATFAAATSRSYSGLTDGPYTFHVVAKDGAANLSTEATAVFTVARPPTVVVTPPASPNSTGSGTFTWVGSDDLTPAVDLTYDFWLTPGQVDPATFVGATTSATFNNLIDGTYTLHIKAKDAAGNVSAPVTSSFTVARPPDTQLLTGPTGTITVNSASFTWTGSDDAPGALTYASQLVGFDAAFSAFGAGTSRNYANLPNGNYTFNVKARDVAGNVDPTPATQAFTVAVVVPTPPAAPSSASAVVIATRTVRVTWTDVATETTYNVQRCRSLFGFCSFAAVASNLPANTTSLDNVVTAAGTYGYRVQACNAAGCSAWTTASNVVVP